MVGEEFYGVFVVPLIVGIVGVLKQLGLKQKIAGLVAWLVGVFFGLLYGWVDGDWSFAKAIIVGSAMGLSASGLYSTQKNVRSMKM